MDDTKEDPERRPPGVRQMFWLWTGALLGAVAILLLVMFIASQVDDSDEPVLPGDRPATATP